jgi:hypothetical protein
MTNPICRFLFALAAIACLAAPTRAQTLIEQSAEHRFQLDFYVPDAALQKMLPAGYEPNIATSGAAKDANLRLVFIDRIHVTGADGKPAGKGTNRVVWLAIPVKESATGTLGQMVIGGLSEDPADAPGSFGTYLPATTHKMQRAISDDTGPVMVTENWDFAAAGGEHFELHVSYERGAAARSAGEAKFISGADPKNFQIVKQEQGLDIMRNVTVQVPDHVKEFSYKAGGGRYAALFDGSEKVLSWDLIPWHLRSMYKP